MNSNTTINDFIADWFHRFDRLEPAEAFLADLHPEVDWNMPNVDPELHGHERFRAWYADILKTFQRPTEHHVSDISVAGDAASFKVLLRARTIDGEAIEINVREHWRFKLRADGRPLITHYSVELLEEEINA